MCEKYLHTWKHVSTYGGRNKKKPYRIWNVCANECVALAEYIKDFNDTSKHKDINWFSMFPTQVCLIVCNSRKHFTFPMLVLYCSKKHLATQTFNSWIFWRAEGKNWKKTAAERQQKKMLKPPTPKKLFGHKKWQKF